MENPATGDGRDGWKSEVEALETKLKAKFHRESPLHDTPC